MKAFGCGNFLDTARRIFWRTREPFSAAARNSAMSKRLSPDSPPAMLWAFTCETGSFDYAKDKWNISIGEDLLVRHNGGAVSLVVATGRGFPRAITSCSVWGCTTPCSPAGDWARSGRPCWPRTSWPRGPTHGFRTLAPIRDSRRSLGGATTAIRKLDGNVRWDSEKSIHYDWPMPDGSSDFKTTVWWRDGRGREKTGSECKTPRRARDWRARDRRERPARDRRDGPASKYAIRTTFLLAHGAEPVPAREPPPRPAVGLGRKPEFDRDVRQDRIAEVSLYRPNGIRRSLDSQCRHRQRHQHPCGTLRRTARRWGQDMPQTM